MFVISNHSQWYWKFFMWISICFRDLHYLKNTCKNIAFADIQILKLTLNMWSVSAYLLMTWAAVLAGKMLPWQKSYVWDICLLLIWQIWCDSDLILLKVRGYWIIVKENKRHISIWMKSNWWWSILFQQTMTSLLNTFLSLLFSLKINHIF